MIKVDLKPCPFFGYEGMSMSVNKSKSYKTKYSTGGEK